jgi:hypothetical protein
MTKKTLGISLLFTTLTQLPDIPDSCMQVARLLLYLHSCFLCSSCAFSSSLSLLAPLLLSKYSTIPVQEPIISSRPCCPCQTSPANHPSSSLCAALNCTTHCSYFCFISSSSSPPPRLNSPAPSSNSSRAASIATVDFRSSHGLRSPPPPRIAGLGKGGTSEREYGHLCLFIYICVYIPHIHTYKEAGERER